MSRDSLADDPGSVLRKPVALASTRCFAFGVGDNRCVADGPVPVAVMAAVIMPPGAEVAVERGCAPGAAGSPHGCTVQILFVPTSYRTERIEGRNTVVFDAPSIMVGQRKAAGTAPSVAP